MLSLTLEPSSAHALSRWAELVLSALQLEALIDETGERERLSSQLSDVRDLLQRAEALGVQDATSAELKPVRRSGPRQEPAHAVAQWQVPVLRTVIRKLTSFSGPASAKLRSIQSPTRRLICGQCAAGTLSLKHWQPGTSPHKRSAASEAQLGEAPTPALAASFRPPRHARRRHC